MIFNFFNSGNKKTSGQNKADYSNARISSTGVVSQNIDKLLERREVMEKLEYISAQYFREKTGI